jgi:hypothetical protein
MLLVDHSNAVLRQYPYAMTGTTRYPIYYIAMWNDLLTGLRGQPLPTRANVGSDAETKLLGVFPDLLVMRVQQIVSGQSRTAGELLIVAYVGALGCTLFLLWKYDRRCREFTDVEIFSSGDDPQEKNTDVQVSDPTWKKPGVVV